MSTLRFEHLGVVEYTEAWDRQRVQHAGRVAGAAPDTVFLLEHPPVYTAGKRTNSWERPQDGTPVVEVDRGGRITWHGPGQIVGYPIVALPDPLDVVSYVRRIEEALILTCADFEVAATRVDGRTGVWVLGEDSVPTVDRKIAAIGVRVAQGVTMHGFALNCDPDLTWYDRIVPCGIPDASVTSLTRECGRNVPVSEVLPYVEKRLAEVLLLAEPT